MVCRDGRLVADSGRRALSPWSQISLKSYVSLLIEEGIENPRSLQKILISRSSFVDGKDRSASGKAALWINYIARKELSVIKSEASDGVTVVSQLESPA